MNKNKHKKVFGITGLKNSGKDTVSNMLEYIHNTLSDGDTITYEGYLNSTLYINQHTTLLSFGDYLKEILSNVYNIDLNYFHDREYKDGLYYSLEDEIFIKKPQDNHMILTLELLQVHSLNNLITLSKESNFKPIIKLRTLLQYFGTDICRKFMMDDFWVRAVKTKINKELETDNISMVIVTDVRFKNESDMIKKFNNSMTISLNRGENTHNDIHESEFIDFTTDFTILNNSTKEDLFKKVLKIYLENK